jgi:hypothetical protein
VVLWWFSVFDFLRPFFASPAEQDDFVFLRPFPFLPFSRRSRELFYFCVPFAFFTLAQQAIFGFGGGFVFFICSPWAISFLRPFLFFHACRASAFCFYILLFCCFRKAEQILR